MYKFSFRNLFIGVVVGLFIFPVVISLGIYLSWITNTNLVTGGKELSEIMKVGYEITSKDIVAMVRLETLINKTIVDGVYLAAVFGGLGFISKYLISSIKHIELTLVNKRSKNS